MENRLSDKKAQGIPSYGTFTQLKSAAAIENIACAPFDFVVIDTEHQAIGTDLMASAVASAQGAGLAPLVRICEISRRAVLHPLDAGAAGLIVPAVKTAEEVRQLVAYAKFAPLGNRGYPGLPLGFFVLLFPGILYGGGQPENVIDPAV